MVKSRIVEAVGTATSSSIPGINPDDMQKAMAAAIQKCFDDGITDPDVIREAQLKAREDYKKGKVI